MEWLWFLNSHAELLYKHMLGDKDTFEMAFMLAGKHEQFHRIAYSPGIPLTALQSNIVQAGWKARYLRKVSFSIPRCLAEQMHQAGASKSMRANETVVLTLRDIGAICSSHLQWLAHCLSVKLSLVLICCFGRSLIDGPQPAFCP